jgi:hypothetical protein
MCIRVLSYSYQHRTVASGLCIKKTVETHTNTLTKRELHHRYHTKQVRYTTKQNYTVQTTPNRLFFAAMRHRDMLCMGPSLHLISHSYPCGAVHLDMHYTHASRITRITLSRCGSVYMSLNRGVHAECFFFASRQKPTTFFVFRN